MKRCDGSHADWIRLYQQIDCYKGKTADKVRILIRDKLARAGLDTVAILKNNVYRR